MYVVDETPDATVFSKAQSRGQKTWTLVEQDATAVETIAHWIALNILTAPPEKLRRALEDCIAWRGFPSKKTAD